MNFQMWAKALQVVPRIDKDEWNKLDIVSKWMISTRAVVLVMTFLSAAIAGILAYQHDKFNLGAWLLLTFGLIFAHATNNLLNDYIDFSRGVDQDNYYRAQYGPQPLVHGLMSKRQLLTYAAVTGLLALAMGIALLVFRGGYTLLLLALGAFFLFFYTYPLKYIAMGELSVLIVWGPLMIGGGYYVITGDWNWNVILASLPYALGVTGVIFGKHIDKYEMDIEKKIHTLPVVIGEKAARYLLLGLLGMQYLLSFYLVAIGFFTPVMLVVILSLPAFLRVLPVLRQPKPLEKPADFPDVWPNWFVASAFFHNRRFGIIFLGGLILETVVRLFLK
jgi:1,4-dihydroxy-2-naphthoate octaprenyltransferase